MKNRDRIITILTLPFSVHLSILSKNKRMPVIHTSHEKFIEFFMLKLYRKIDFILLFHSGSQ